MPWCYCHITSLESNEERGSTGLRKGSVDVKQRKRLRRRKKAEGTESKKKVVAAYASLRFCGGRTH